MTRRGGDALYTQFCIGVELGDDSLVRDLVHRGADTMVSYGVDGVITTPMHSALSKGDIPMALALLSSRNTKVKLADLDAAPKVKKELITPVLLQRLSMALEDGGREMLLQRSPIKTRGGKVLLAQCLTDHFRSASPVESEESSETEVHASPTDRPRCPPGDPALSPRPESENEDEEHEEMEESEEEKASTAGSMVSSAGETTEDER